MKVTWGVVRVDKEDVIAMTRQFMARAATWLMVAATGPESPHQVALGVGIGVAVAFTPTMGGQMAIAGALAGVCRGSVRAALPTVWITNPLTAAPIYLAVYQVGLWLIPAAEAADDLLDDVPSAWAAAGDAAMALAIGGMVVGVVLGLASYVAVRAALTWKRRAVSVG